MAHFCRDYQGGDICNIFLQTIYMRTIGALQRYFPRSKINQRLIICSIEECVTPVPSILEECPSPPSYIFTPGRRQESVLQSPPDSCNLDEKEADCAGDYHLIFCKNLVIIHLIFW